MLFVLVSFALNMINSSVLSFFVGIFSPPFSGAYRWFSWVEKPPHVDRYSSDARGEFLTDKFID